MKEDDEVIENRYSAFPPQDDVMSFKSSTESIFYKYVLAYSIRECSANQKIVNYSFCSLEMSNYFH